MPKSVLFPDNEAFKAICQSAVEGIIVLDHTGRIKIANDATSSMFGYDKDELIGKRIDNIIPRRFRMEHIGHVAKFFEKPSPRKMGHGRDLWGLKKSGEEFPLDVSLNATIIHDQHYSIAFVIDISERKNAEDALKKSEEQLLLYANELENKVKERTEKLNNTVDKLGLSNKILQEEIKEREKAEAETQRALGKERDLNQLKSRFVSMASHEFRTPLSTILSSASLIGRYNTDDTSDKRAKHVNRIKSSVGNLTSILDDFLSLGKLEEGRVDIVPSSIEVDKCILEVIDEMNMILKQGQEIKFETSGNAFLLETDRRLLKNVLTNLTSNAIKYSENQPIIIALTYEEEKVGIKIIDRGVGIPESDRKHLFTRFFRAGNVINIQGTGLGLNIVKKYLELLKGSIYFESKQNKGTTFTIELPLKIYQR
ncbi:MAG: PAS domain-containing sensor histidine kinase [Bacteroidetes bacterium]|nr:PAS domain-containing sensor histidine kinase [Bacteroidota bacterium]MDA1119168.1 PAS domain-containing sensor histidine kinase [Bacteroidota bacterium]